MVRRPVVAVVEHDDDVVRRAGRAEACVQVGELSSARQCLEGAPVAPGNRNTLFALRDPSKRPAEPRDPIPADVLEFQPGLLSIWMWKVSHGTFDVQSVVLQGGLLEGQQTIFVLFWSLRRTQLHWGGHRPRQG